MCIEKDRQWRKLDTGEEIKKKKRTQFVAT